MEKSATYEVDVHDESETYEIDVYTLPRNLPPSIFRNEVLRQMREATTHSEKDTTGLFDTDTEEESDNNKNNDSLASEGEPTKVTSNPTNCTSNMALVEEENRMENLAPVLELEQHITNLFVAPHHYHGWVGIDPTNVDSVELKYLRSIDIDSWQGLDIFEQEDDKIRQHFTNDRPQQYAVYKQTQNLVMKGLSFDNILPFVIPEGYMGFLNDHFQCLKPKPMGGKKYGDSIITAIYYTMMVFVKWCCEMSRAVSMHGEAHYEMVDYFHDLRVVMVHGLDWYRRKYFFHLNEDKRKEFIYIITEQFINDILRDFKKPNKGYIETVSNCIPIHCHYHLHDLCNLSAEVDKDKIDRAIVWGVKPYYPKALNQFIIYTWQEWLLKAFETIKQTPNGHMLYLYGAFDLNQAIQ